MRLLGQIEGNGLAFSHFLAEQGIQNQCDQTPDGLFQIWVVDEDDVQKAEALFAEYQQNPKDPKYQVVIPIEEEELEEDEEETPPPLRKQRGFLSSAPYGAITIGLLATCILLFFWAQIQHGTSVPPPIRGVIQAPVLPPIEQKLIFNYPTYFQERDKLLTLYTPKEIKERTAPSEEALLQIHMLQKKTTWMGAYSLVVDHIRNGASTLSYHGPIFENIKSGEVWRLITPIFLHFDFLHIFFNLLWLIILGNQIEYRIGKLRYLALVIVAAVVTNTAQYLMSGPFFMGLSGVVCAMAAFIWARQLVAPWEGYLLHRLTLIFLGIFVGGMFALQAAFFFLQIFTDFQASIGIANTAHIMGGIVGYLLGRMRRCFAIKPAKCE
ncbi:MAG: Rhomboid protease GlpG [Chlamydiales bacterium]|nr:Rhomboid protease GlpG [Chlamydiales bacterium]MCH9635450.1 Rhomboid protease GlpG [Chlamydiales bacterium]